MMAMMMVMLMTTIFERRNTVFHETICGSAVVCWKYNNSITDDDDFDDDADGDVETMMMAMMMSSSSASIPSSMKSSGVQQLCDQHSSDGQITRLPNIVPASPLYYAPYNGPPAQVQQTIKSIVLTIFYNNNIALHCVRFLEQSAQCRLIDWCIGFYGHYGPEGPE